MLAAPSRMDVILATIASLAAAISGHVNAHVAAHHQPAELAVFKGHFKTGPGDLTLFGIPDEEEGRVKFAPPIPGGLNRIGQNPTPVLAASAGLLFEFPSQGCARHILYWHYSACFLFKVTRDAFHLYVAAACLRRGGDRAVCRQ